MPNTTFYPTSTCFLCSLDLCILFIQLCLDKNKSWILYSRFHCFFLKLSQTIAREEGFHTHSRAKSSVHRDCLQIMRTNANIFPQLNPALCEIHKKQSSPSDRGSRSTASRNKPGFCLLFQHRSQGRTRRNTIY